LRWRVEIAKPRARSLSRAVSSDRTMV
jgi:hypothetical protein